MQEERVGSLEGEALNNTLTKKANADKRISRKLVAVILAAVLLGVSGFYVWYNYYRPWTINDLEDAVITWEYAGMSSAGIDVGFKTYLEGRTVTVKGTVHKIGSIDTSLGQMNKIYLEGGTFAYLTQWGLLDISEGDRVKVRVTFERGTINGEEHIYSPQVGFPGYGQFVATQMVSHAVSWVTGENWLIASEDMGDDVVIRVNRTVDPVPLGMARCNIRQGTSTGIIEYIDVLGLYDDKPDLDAIPDLRNAFGLNGVLKFTDDNSDGYLDDGDFITISGMIRPDTITGAQSYLLSVERDRYPDEPEADRPVVFYAYLIMTSGGLLWSSPETPVGTSFVHGTNERVELVVDCISEPISWDDTVLLISDGTYVETCRPSADLLSQGPLSSSPCGMLVFKDFQLDCKVFDLAGDGLLSKGDRVELLAANGTNLEPGHVITVRFLYNITHAETISDQFTCGMAPTSECETEYSGDSMRITLAPLHNGTGIHYEHIDVPWDDLLVMLKNESDSVEWQLASDDLNAATSDSWSSSPTAMGNLALVCSVFDLQGNGLANTGDVIELSPTNDGEFDPGANYTAVLVHVLTDAVIYSVTFVG